MSFKSAGQAAVADLYGCHFEGCASHMGCGENGPTPGQECGRGGAVRVGTGADVLIADSVFHDNRAGCLGGAISAASLYPSPGAHTINIMRTKFTANHQDSGKAGHGNDVAIVAPAQISCPPPGTACDLGTASGMTCCFEEDYESLSVVLSTG